MEINRRAILLFLSLVMLSWLIISRLFPSSGNQVSQFETLEDYLYSSPILKSYRPLFTLSGKRIIDMTIKKDVLVAKNTAPIAPRVVGSPLPSVVPTPTAIAKAKPTPTAEPQISETSTSGLIITQIPDSKKSNDSNWGKDDSFFGNGGNVQAQPQPNLDQQIHDWKYRLSQSPTKENMNAFVKEYSTGNISKSTFYSVIKALLDQNDELTQYIALYGLAATPSFESYDILASRMADHNLNPNNIRFDETILEYYSQPTSISILIGALKSPNDVVVMEAIHNISQINKKNKVEFTDPHNPTDNRLRRGTITNGGIRVETMKLLLETLRSLSSSHNAQIASNSELLIQKLESASLQQSSTLPPSAYNQPPAYLNQ